jgi:ornithine carbamoyltransferase
MADLMTMREHFGPDLSGRTMAFIGDGNNVARSLSVACGKLGVRFILASPAGYELPAADMDRIMSQVPQMDFQTTHSPAEAVKEADVIYTDTWVSMGQESDKQRRQHDFAGYCIDEKLLAAAPEHAIVMHCLPAYRGMEISESAFEAHSKTIFQEASNRLHFQKGLLAVLMGGA